jgi:shikimate kinase
MIAAQFKLSIPRIFETRGEDFFRDAETKVLRSFDSDREAIIVTGGGIVLRTSNRELLRKLGVVVYLQADEETLFERLSRRSNRPLLRTDDPRTTMRDLLEKRVPLYEEIADLAVDTSRLDHDQVCDLILENLKAGKTK